MKNQKHPAGIFLAFLEYALNLEYFEKNEPLSLKVAPAIFLLVVL